MGEHGERSKSFHEVDGDSHRSQVPGSGRLSQGAGKDQGTACRGKGEGNPQTAASDHDERDVAGRQRMTKEIITVNLATTTIVMLSMGLVSCLFLQYIWALWLYLHTAWLEIT